MKKLIFLLLTVCGLTFVLISSCKKETKDPCEGITCLNGGTCANGSCNCPQGYSGSNCSQQLTPTKVTITKVQVTRFPATDAGGAGWDPTSGPELYPKISLGSSTIYSSSTYYIDASTSLVPYDFTPSPYIELTSPTSQYTIEAYDYDTLDPDDWMGGIYFYPYSSTGGFPSTIIIDGGGSVAFKLYVTYTW